MRGKAQVDLASFALRKVWRRLYARDCAGGAAATRWWLSTNFMPPCTEPCCTLHGCNLVSLQIVAPVSSRAESRALPQARLSKLHGMALQLQRANNRVVHRATQAISAPARSLRLSTVRTFNEDGKWTRGSSRRSNVAFLQPGDRSLRARIVRRTPANACTSLLVSPDVATTKPSCLDRRLSRRTDEHTTDLAAFESRSKSQVRLTLDVFVTAEKHACCRFSVLAGRPDSCA